MDKTKGHCHKEGCVTQDACLRCASAGDTCCMDMCAPLSVSDIERICALGNNLEDFAELHDYSDDNDPEHEDWWRESMVEHGGRKYKIITKTKENSHCFFLIPGKGCALGDKRPLTCKMYPYWISADGLITYGDTDCFLVKCGTVPTEGISMITETPDTLTDYYKLIAEDCKNNKGKAKEMVIRLLENKRGK